MHCLKSIWMKYRGLDAKITHKVSSSTFIASPWSADMIGPGENFIVTGILWNAKSWIQIIYLHITNCKGGKIVQYLKSILFAFSD